MHAHTTKLKSSDLHSHCNAPSQPFKCTLHSICASDIFPTFCVCTFFIFLLSRYPTSTIMQGKSFEGQSGLSPSAPQTPAKELSMAAKRLSSSGQSPIGSERGASPAMANKLTNSSSTLSSTLGYGPSDGSSQARESSSRHSPASSVLNGADDLSSSGTLDPNDQEGIRAVSSGEQPLSPSDLY